MFAILERPEQHKFDSPVALRLLVVNAESSKCQEYDVSVQGFTLYASKFTIETMTHLIRSTIQKTTCMESEAACDNLFMNHVLTQIAFLEEDKYADNVHFVCDIVINKREAPVMVIVQTL